MNDNLKVVPTNGLARRGSIKLNQPLWYEPPWSHDHGVMPSNLGWFEIFDPPGKPGTLASEFSLNQILQNSFWQCHSWDNWVGSEIGVKLLEWPNGAVWVQRDCPNRPHHYGQIPETLQGRSRNWCKVYIVIHWDSTLHWITYSGMSVENMMIHPLHPAGSPPCITVW